MVTIEISGAIAHIPSFLLIPTNAPGFVVVSGFPNHPTLRAIEENDLFGPVRPGIGGMESLAPKKGWAEGIRKDGIFASALVMGLSPPCRTTGGGGVGA